MQVRFLGVGGFGEVTAHHLTVPGRSDLVAVKRETGYDRLLALAGPELSPALDLLMALQEIW